MGFDFSKYESSGGKFITAAEKAVIAENGIPFKVVSIAEKFKFENENYELTILLPNPETGDEEERILSFAIGTGAESRDAMLKAMKDYLDGGGDALDAKLEKKGRGYYLREA